MKKVKKALLLVMLIAVCVVLYFKVFAVNKGTRVIEWNNIYNEGNLTFFYENQDSINESTKLKNLNDTYNISGIISEEETELKKVIKTTEILNTILEYDDVKESLNNNGYDILKEKGVKKKAAAKDMAITERDLLLSAGYISRVGEFRKKQPQFEKSPNYYIVEYWSPKYNKWVMVDFLDKGYLEKSNTPLSAIEVLESDVKELIYVGSSTQNDYRKKLEKYLNSYTIAIDNTLSSRKSNSYVTYIKNSKDVDIIVKSNYINPTIFTQNKDLFSITPGVEATGEDSRAYLILMKKPVSGKEESLAFVTGAFKDGSIIEECYIKINDGDFEKIKMYKEFELKKGENTIQLSMNGSEVISTIKIKKDK